MALGKNLKKDKLIPSKAKEDLVNKGGTPSKKKSSSKNVSKDDKELVLSHKKIKVISEEVFKERERIREKFVREIEGMKGSRVQLIHFNLGTENYALEIRQVKEVVKLPPIVNVPHVPDYVMGVATIKGESIAVIDLTVKFDLKVDSAVIPESEDEEEYGLLIARGRNKIIVWLGGMPGTSVVEGELISNAVEVSAEISLNETYIKGFIQQENKITVLLDAIDLLESSSITAVAELVKEG